MVNLPHDIRVLFYMESFQCLEKFARSRSRSRTPWGVQAPIHGAVLDTCPAIKFINVPIAILSKSKKKILICGKCTIVKLIFLPTCLFVPPQLHFDPICFDEGGVPSHLQGSPNVGGAIVLPLGSIHKGDLQIRIQFPRMH